METVYKKCNFFTILFLLMVMFVSFSDSYAQDAPSGYTSHYGLRTWSENTNPSADSLNANWNAIDEILYDLIVETDPTQYIIKNSVLIRSDTASGMSAFTGTDQYDTVEVKGLDSLDVVNVSVRETIPTANDALGVFLKSDTLIVGRPSSGTSGLKWNWNWIRKYQ